MSMLDCFLKFPFFDLGDFLLRELKESDALHYLMYMEHPEVSKNIPDYMVPKSLSHAHMELRYWRDMFHSKKGFFWGVAKKSNNKLVGTIGFNFINFFNKKGEINYDLNRDYWGKGIMTSALTQVVEFSRDIGLVRIQATALEDNARSIKLLESGGFTREGLLKNYELVGDSYYNSYMYAKIFEPKAQ
jgi:[ribosomal protein S5]-alanine N-acetyltransferase